MSFNILVTGSCGFLGEEIVNSFSQNNLIYALDKEKPITYSNNEANIKTIICDIRKTDDLEKVFIKHKIDILIHCAAEILDEKDPNEVWKTNFNGTKNLLDLSEKYKIKKFVFTSTFSIFEKNYDSPIDEKEPSSAIVDYGKSKYAAENLILSHTFSGDTIIFRCPVVIGRKRLDKLALLFEMVRQNINIWLIGDGSNKIHFIYSLDLINAISLSIELRGKYLFNIGSDSVNSIHAVFTKLLMHANSKKKIKKFPKRLGIFLLKIFNFLNLLNLGPYHQRMLVSNCVLNTERIKKNLKWEPKYSNERMLIECYDSYISNLGSKSEVSSSKKIPNLRIIKLLKFFNL
jgi:nucleoside-diphosphate-sugar epimerase